jgi:hypothetical protein
MSRAPINRVPYAVGKGKPPLGTRWKKGQSGNPRGRPRKLASFYASLRTALEEQVKITEDGVTRRVTAFEALISRLRADSARGSWALLEVLLKLQRAFERPAPQSPDPEQRRQEASFLDDDDLRRMDASISAYYLVKVFRARYGPPPSGPARKGDDLLPTYLREVEAQARRDTVSEYNDGDS